MSKSYHSLELSRLKLIHLLEEILEYEELPVYYIDRIKQELRNV